MFTRARLSRWTAALRANPEQQHVGSLANASYTKFCCLGKLCEVEGIARNPAKSPWSYSYGYVFDETRSETRLKASLCKAFGSDRGHFLSLNMPDLEYKQQQYGAAWEANDAGVPWPVIADHFDKYYPCEDEQNP